MTSHSASAPPPIPQDQKYKEGGTLLQQQRLSVVNLSSDPPAVTSSS